MTASSIATATVSGIFDPDSQSWVVSRQSTKSLPIQHFRVSPVVEPLDVVELHGPVQCGRVDLE
jgi:hypothetical protein